MTANKMHRVTVLLSLLCLMFAETSIAQVTNRLVSNKVLQKLNKQYEEIEILGQQYPGSELIIGRRRVKCISRTCRRNAVDPVPESNARADTAQQSDDSLQQERELAVDVPGEVVEVQVVGHEKEVYDLLTTKGEVVVQNLEFASKLISRYRPGGCVWGRVSECVDTASSTWHVVDLMNVKLTGTGSNMSGWAITGSATVETIRKGPNGREVKNYFVPGLGLVRRWDDPMVERLVGLWVHRESIALVVREAESLYRVLNLDGTDYTNMTFSYITHELMDNLDYPFRTVYIKHQNQEESFSFDMIERRLAARSVIKPGMLQWWYCDGGYDSDCIERIQFTSVANRHPSQFIREALVTLTIKSEIDDRIFYRKKHWITVNLAPDEVGASSEIVPDQVIRTDGHATWSCEVHDYR